MKICCYHIYSSQVVTVLLLPFPALLLHTATKIAIFITMTIAKCLNSIRTPACSELVVIIRITQQRNYKAGNDAQIIC
jgi:hypothetical protein